MTEKPLEQILDEAKDALQQPEELQEMYRILDNYRNRSLSRKEHERIQELHSSIESGDIAKYSGDLEARFAERAELDFKYMENIKGYPTPRITTGRYENALFALGSYISLGKKLNLPSKLMKKAKRLRFVYDNAEFSDDEKYAYLDFDRKTPLVKEKKASKPSKPEVSKKSDTDSIDRSVLDTKPLYYSGYNTSSSIFEDETFSYALAGTVFLGGLVGMIAGTSYICENSELFGTSCKIGAITGELIYSLVGLGLGYVNSDEHKPLTVAAGLGAGAVSTIGSVLSTKIVHKIFSEPLANFTAELDWISGISGGIIGTPALAFGILVGIAAAFGDSK